MTTETSKALTRLSTQVRPYLLVPQVPDAAQMSAHGHVQVRIGTGYVSTDTNLYHGGGMTAVQRAEVKLALVKGIEASNQTSYSGGSRPYVPLDIVPDADGQRGTIQIAGVPALGFLVDPGVSLDPSSHQGSVLGGLHEVGDEGDDEAADEDEVAGDDE